MDSEPVEEVLLVSHLNDGEKENSKMIDEAYEWVDESDDMKTVVNEMEKMILNDYEMNYQC
jgi:hypothetical protein